MSIPETSAISSYYRSLATSPSHATSMLRTSSFNGASSQQQLSTSLARTPSQSASEPSFWQQAGGLFQEIAAAYQSGKAARATHAAQQLGLRAGLTQYRQAQQQAGLSDLLLSVLSNGVSGRGGPLDALIQDVGSTAQAYVVKEAGGALQNYLAQEFGVDAATASTADIFSSVIDGIFGTNLSSGAATANNAALLPAASGAQSGASTAAGKLGQEAFETTGGQILGAIGAAYSGFQMLSQFGERTPEAGAVQGASIGAYVGSMILPGIGTAIGTGIGTIAGGLLGSIKVGKHEDQKLRDSMREQLQKIGFINDQHEVELEGGTLFNIGYDGGHTYQNIDGTSRRAYQIDTSNPLAHEVIGWVQPLAAVLTGGHPKLGTDLTGYLVNAALSNAGDYETARNNVLALYQQAGIAPDQFVQALAAVSQQQGSMAVDLEAYLAGFKLLLEGFLSDGTPVVDEVPSGFELDELAQKQEP